MDFPFYHRRTSDPALAPLFPVYFKKLRGLWESGTRWYRKQFPMEYWSAELQIANDHLTVALEPRDHFTFEFFTSGNPLVTGTVTQGTFTFPAIKAACVAVDVQVDRKNGITWNAAIRAGKRSFDGTELSLVKRPCQVQLINEPVLNPPPATLLLGREKQWNFVYESFAPMHSHTGVHFRSYNTGYRAAYQPGGTRDTFAHNYLGTNNNEDGNGKKAIRIDYTINQTVARLNPLSAHMGRDVGYDVPYMDGKKAGAVRTGYLNDGTVDWPRANGVITIKSAAYGDREFAICVDASNQFSVFPTSKIEAALLSGTTQTVNPMYVKLAAPTLPTWVYNKTTRFRDWYSAHSTIGISDFPEYDWKVSPDGTKACAVVYERVAVTFDSAYFAGDTNAAANFTSYLAQTGFGSRYGGSLPGTYSFDGADQRYQYGPGLLEATITIALTGPNPEDFTLNVTVAEVRRPTTSAYCTFLAGYVYHDIKNAAGTVIATRGDLCVLDIERYYRLPPGVDTGTDIGSSQRPLPGNGNEDALYSLKNLTASTELNTWSGPEGERLLTDGNSWDGSVLDYDMHTLSFAFAAARVQKIGLSSFGGSGMAVAVWTMNTFREIFYPDNMPQSIRDGFAAVVTQGDYRTAMITSEWIFMPLNEARDWTDVDLNALREHMCWSFGFGTTAHPTPWLDNPGTGGSTTPVNYETFATQAWFCGVYAHVSPYGLAFISNPKFGWYTYSDLMMSALCKTPWSTFFTHPSGTWALFDQTMVYDYGNVLGTSTADYDVTKLEHFMVDRVHFEYTMPDGVVMKKDTTFKDLYNAAVDALPPEQTDFTHLTAANMRAAFAKTSAGGTWDYVQLQVTWDGATYQFSDCQVNAQPHDLFTSQPLPPLTGGYQLRNLSLDAVNDSGGSLFTSALHRTFSSCLLIQ